MIMPNILEAKAGEGNWEGRSSAGSSGQLTESSSDSEFQRRYRYTSNGELMGNSRS